MHDNIAHALRLKELRSRKDFRGRLRAFFDAAQGWILSFVCGVIIALIAYGVNVSESVIFDFKEGYCGRAWYLNEQVRVAVLCRRGRRGRQQSVLGVRAGNISWPAATSSVHTWGGLLTGWNFFF